MKYYGQQLAGKLRRLLVVANEHKGETLDDEALSKLVEEGRYDEFSYQSDTGTSYTKDKTIRKYIRFLRILGLLTLNPVSPAIGTEELKNNEDFELTLGDRANDTLSEFELYVEKIRNEARRILRDDTFKLPTLDNLYDRLQPNQPLSRQNFKWLIYLYLLTVAPTVYGWQKPLLVPRTYIEE